MGIPDPNADGLLPQDALDVSFSQIRSSYLVTGVGCKQRGVKWDVARRERLLEQLEAYVTLVGPVLRTVEEWWVGGSFVEVEPSPLDIDVYFVLRDPSPLEVVRCERALDALSPTGLYSLDHRRFIACHGALARSPLWCLHKVDVVMDTRFASGRTDPIARELSVAEVFRRKKGSPLRKGIVRLDLTRP